jgi:hypothetical protein
MQDIFLETQNVTSSLLVEVHVTNLNLKRLEISCSSIELEIHSSHVQRQQRQQIRDASVL